MNQTAQRLLFVVIIGLLVGLAHGMNYLYLTHYEETLFGDGETCTFTSGDTLDGPVRTNTQLHISGNPVFYDVVITTASDFWRGPGYDPYFAVPPTFNSPEFTIPRYADIIRDMAIEQGHYFENPGFRARIIISEDSLNIWWFRIGTPLDSFAVTQFYELPDSAVVWFDCPVWVSGTVHGILILGCSRTACLEDNILYVSSDPVDGRLMPGHPEKFALISEGDIKIMNTPQNGRENSAGEGHNQPDQNLNSIALNGFYAALSESFTFEQQNDPDSGYVCDCYPDERGTIYLWGGIIQHRRGYLHRSNNSSTGYLKHLRYDDDLRFWDFGLYPWSGTVSTDTIDFGQIPRNSTAWDTMEVHFQRSQSFGLVYATYPFYSPGSIPHYGEDFEIPVRFTPPGIGRYTGTLTLRVWPWDETIILLGEGIEPEEGPPVTGIARQREEQ